MVNLKLFYYLLTDILRLSLLNWGKHRILDTCFSPISSGRKNVGGKVYNQI